VSAAPFIDAVNGFKAAVTLTVTNVGHRPATAAIRSRMVGFRVEGPDGPAHCHAAPPSRAMPREGYQTLRPGGSTTLTILLNEACGRDLFRRPGLYRVASTLHLDESGAALGLSAVTGAFHAVDATLVRIAEGPDPFYKRPPQAVRAPRTEGDEAPPRGRADHPEARPSTPP
jgi:hypothetical protein